MSDQEQAQNIARSEIQARWERGESIGLVDVARAYSVPLSDVWGILQKLEKQQQRRAK
jgi:hypothetical protein